MMKRLESAANAPEHHNRITDDLVREARMFSSIRIIGAQKFDNKGLNELCLALAGNNNVSGRSEALAFNFPALSFVIHSVGREPLHVDSLALFVAVLPRWRSPLSSSRISP